MPLRKLLFVTYYFPPLGGPGAIRPTRFCQYLPEFNWGPIVLTPKKIAYYTQDESLLEGLGDLDIVRTESFDPARFLYLAGKKSISWKGGRQSIRWLFNLPDSKLGWLPGAISAGAKILDKVDLILATAPPFTSLLIGLILARIGNKPYVVDFRDAWLDFPFVPYRGLYRKLNYLMERKVVNSSRHIVVVSELIKQKLMARYPLDDDAITIVPNGYDSDDFRDHDEPPEFTIVHLGTLRRSRDPGFLFGALRELLQDNMIDARTRVKFIGNVLPEVVAKAREFNIEKNVIFLQHQPYRRAIKELNSAHLLFLIADKETAIFPSRQCEYLATGLPIVVLGKTSTSEVFEAARKKYSYPLKMITIDDVEMIKKEICYYYQKFREGAIKRKKIDLKVFDRRNQTQKLAEIFDKLVK